MPRPSFFAECYGSQRWFECSVEILCLGLLVLLLLNEAVLVLAFKWRSAVLFGD